PISPKTPRPVATRARPRSRMRKTAAPSCFSVARPAARFIACNRAAIVSWPSRGEARRRVSNSGIRAEQAVVEVAAGAVFLKFVAQRADRDAQELGGPGAVAAGGA